MGKTHYISDDKESIHLNLARLKKDGENFEVPINSEEAIRFKEGADIDISEVINVAHIFFDAHKGELASETRMESLFGTSDPYKVAEIILKNGEIQLTSEIRDRERQRKFNLLVARIAQDAIDPKTRLPHPIERIKLAFSEAKIKVDEFRTVEHQIKDVIKKLQPILPLSFEKKVITYTIPGDFSGKAQGPVRKFGKIKDEQWGENGEWIITIELSGAAAQELEETLKNMTRGKVHINVLK